MGAARTPRLPELTTPCWWPCSIDCEKECRFWPATSLTIVASSSRAASREYCGSSAISDAAVSMEIVSSSRVVAPS